MERDFDGYLADVWPRQPEPKRTATARQLEALRYTSHGLGMAEAAEAMGISMWSVDDLLDRARTGLAAKNTTHAVAIALRLGLID